MKQKSRTFRFVKDTFIARNVDEVAEWLRRWTANPLGSARVGSNPIFVDSFLNLDLHYEIRGSIFLLS